MRTSSNHRDDRRRRSSRTPAGRTPVRLQDAATRFGGLNHDQSAIEDDCLHFLGASLREEDQGLVVGEVELECSAGTGAVFESLVDHFHPCLDVFSVVHTLADAAGGRRILRLGVQCEVDHVHRLWAILHQRLDAARTTSCCDRRRGPLLS